MLGSRRFGLGAATTALVSAVLAVGGSAAAASARSVSTTSISTSQIRQPVRQRTVRRQRLLQPADPGAGAGLLTGLGTIGLAPRHSAVHGGARGRPVREDERVGRVLPGRDEAGHRAHSDVVDTQLRHPIGRHLLPSDGRPDADQVTTRRPRICGRARSRHPASGPRRTAGVRTSATRSSPTGPASTSGLCRCR